MAIRDEESYNSEVFIPLFELSGYLSEISFDEEKNILNTHKCYNKMEASIYKLDNVYVLSIDVI